MAAQDKTSYVQSLTHMIKGNLGAGLLGMGSSFAHLGLAGAFICLPVLCLICGGCVHLLIRTAQKVGSRLDQHAVDVSDARRKLDYPTLAKRALEWGPSWAQQFGPALGRLVDIALLVTQIGICCVYLVFVVENLVSIFATYHVHLTKSMVFVGIFPIALLLSFIRTLKRLALASTAANLLQFCGLALIIEFLSRDLSHINLKDRDAFRPLGEMALGFGSSMFAFEGISMVLPIYARLKRPNQMASTCGLINISFLVILCLYFVVGLLSYLKFGHDVRDSITLNLPAEPLYDCVRGMFTISILLSYPLQFYVPNEMIWKWAKRNLLGPSPSTLAALSAAAAAAAERASNANEFSVEKTKSKPDKDTLALALRTIEMVANSKTKPMKVNESIKVAQLNASELATVKPVGDIESFASLPTPTSAMDEKHKLKMDELIRSIQESSSTLAKQMPQTTNKIVTLKAKQLDGQSQSDNQTECSDLSDDAYVLGHQDASLDKYEYYCRVIVVSLTFTLAASVPKLNLLMDLIGSFSGAALSTTIPAIIHLAAYWDSTKGFTKCAMVIMDSFIIVTSLAAGMGGSITSLASIVRGF